ESAAVTWPLTEAPFGMATWPLTSTGELRVPSKGWPSLASVELSERPKRTCRVVPDSTSTGLAALRLGAGAVAAGGLDCGWAFIAVIASGAVAGAGAPGEGAAAVMSVLVPIWLLTWVTPGIWASCCAALRAASLPTEPVRVATPLSTVALTPAPCSAGSALILLWIAVVNDWSWLLALPWEQAAMPSANSAPAAQAARRAAAVGKKRECMRASYGAK